MKKDEKKKAVAMHYDHSTASAPKITASGKGYVADNIITSAKAHGVPIQEDETLVELLSQLEINEKIPEELYQVVAEVFAFIYQADKNY